ncbi:hypothetical protein DERP_008185 [Dermatophagoides pteronyssinus]|uniref:Uncharacterized protein n=1 Tax=Dermatophagoides pteronyssinus TaxID=6956 RepID=A0ABQ8JJZ3_DERPT|nr:hypothetical protein DERP_008185 [Dermatophagoides pteronyssinus]
MNDYYDYPEILRSLILDGDLPETDAVSPPPFKCGRRAIFVDFAPVPVLVLEPAVVAAVLPLTAIQTKSAKLIEYLINGI